jgi:hypothetical protein
VRLSAQILKQEENIEMLKRWKMGKSPRIKNLKTHLQEDEPVRNSPRGSRALLNRFKITLLIILQHFPLPPVREGGLAEVLGGLTGPGEVSHFRTSVVALVTSV